jgi:hemerythrin superfamily protein
LRRDLGEVAGEVMTATEDLFTPIHKAIRSMIYDVSGRLQTNDFTDVAASTPLLADLEHEFSTAISSGCILCLLHHHASDEETAVFPSVSKHDAALVQGFIEDHHALARRLETITKMARDLPSRARPDERVQLGITLNQKANEFFAAYVDHMNREEEKLVPLMRERFTDDQMRAMRGAVMAGMPPDRLASLLRWMLPSLNVSELTEMLGGIKVSSPPQVLKLISGIAEQRVDPERWQTVKGRLGI